MPVCNECGATLANVSSRRRHVNTQHKKSQMHSCVCGREFLDPAGASRCKSSHYRTFGCPVNGCFYTNPRKDAVKQHIRRRHRGFLDLEVLTLPPNSRSTSPVSSASTGDPSPSPGPFFVLPPMLQAPFGAPLLWPLQPPFYYPAIPLEAGPGYHGYNAP